eukprot:13898353-Alexandrium_andersonii.AAC.1
MGGLPSRGSPGSLRPGGKRGGRAGASGVRASGAPGSGSALCTLRSHGLLRAILSLLGLLGRRRRVSSRHGRRRDGRRWRRPGGFFAAPSG